MEMPTFLPPTLDSYRSSQNEDELFNALSKNIQDLITFFMMAVDDEYFRADHLPLIRKLLKIITERSFEEKLLLNDKLTIQQKIQDQHLFLKPLLPLDITFEVQEETFPENSLLFSAASPFLQDFIRANHFKLDDIAPKTFQIMEEFVVSGDVPDLWKLTEEELRNLHEDVKRYQLPNLCILCENILKRYITRDNALSMLIQAHLDGWLVLRHACYDKLNGLDLGFKFHETAPHILAFEFFDYKENAMDVFNAVKGLITHLYVSSSLAEDRMFSYVVNQCPLLVGLNLRLTQSFSERIFDTPSSIKELGISSCNWLNAKNFRRIIETFKNLKVLNLSDNIQLDYNTWGMLSSLKDLASLTISRNPQIDDEGFKLIVQASPSIIELDCSDCKKIGDKGFYELTRSLSHLIFLNLENCQISDGILIELAVKSPFLEEINLSKCQLLTDRGFLEFVKQSRALRKMIVNQCQIKEETFKEIKRQKNNIEIIV